MTEIFPITPAASRAPIFLAVVALVLLVTLVLLVYLAYSSRHSRVEVGPDSIRLVGDLWGRRVPLRSLDLAGARVLDLGSAGQLRPVGRRFGTGLPGYASGWFRLANGERALVYLTDWRHVAYVPTREGYSLLLSLAAPQAFLDRLSALQGGAPARGATDPP
ncbi:MAG TPA: PH domain-containing protein [Myxococcota bacterium]|nr:PH domain-containing protein [Myxococcota bacterium]